MYSLTFTGFFKQYRIKNIWLPPGIEPRTTCLTHKCSATELRQQAGKQTIRFCIYIVKGYCYATVSLSTDQRKFSFFKDFFLFVEFFYFTIFSIPSDGDQIILILYCLKKACERERIHLMSKRRLRKKLRKTIRLEI